MLSPKQVMRLPRLDAAITMLRRYGAGYPKQLVSPSRTTMALKAGVAGAAAWYLALLIPQVSAYAYYAPFGAVIAMTFSAADSVRQVLRVFLAITLGAVLAMGSGLVPYDGISVALIILLGLVLAGLPVFGNVGPWIPMTAIFVLIIGDARPGLYVGAYVGLTTMGAVIAALINTAVPPLPLSSADQLQVRVRNSLADRMDELAEWTKTSVESARSAVMENQVLGPLLSEIWSATNRTTDARRANVRARRYADWIQRQHDAADRLERLVYLAQEIIQLIAQGMESDGHGPRISGGLRSQLSSALEAYATALRWAETDSPERRQAIAAASQCLRAMREEIPDDDWQVTGVLVAVRRSLQILVPEAYEPPEEDEDEDEEDDEGDEADETADGAAR